MQRRMVWSIALAGSLVVGIAVARTPCPPLEAVEGAEGVANALPLDGPNRALERSWRLVVRF